MKILNLFKLSVLILELKKGPSCSLKSKYFLSELKFFSFILRVLILCTVVD